MRIKQLLIEDRRTKFLLFNKTTKETLELQKIEGVWSVIDKHETKQLNLDDLYRLIFKFGSFMCKGKKRPYRVLFTRDLAINLVRRGYFVLDSCLNRYECQNNKLLRNGKEQLVDLPEMETYILLPFQKFIEEKETRKENIPIYEQSHEPKKEIFIKKRRRRIKSEKKEENVANQDNSTKNENIWEWIIPIAAGSIGIAALAACLLGKTNNNHQNRMYYEY